jgi:hypothetical protein
LSPDGSSLPLAQNHSGIRNHITGEIG